MLGKLFISGNSKTEKLQTTTELVKEAIDEKVAQDALSRNALNKLHIALSKALGDAEQVKLISEHTLAPAGGDDSVTTVQKQRVRASFMAGEEDGQMDGIRCNGNTETQDSLLGELLD